MPREMSAIERVNTAVALGKPDRVPVIPFGSSFTATLGGYTAADLFQDPELVVAAYEGTWNKFGGWDAIYPALFTNDELAMAFVFPMKIKVPGRDIPADTSYQLVEEVVFTADEYDLAIQQGFKGLSMEIALRVRPGKSKEELLSSLQGRRENISKFRTLAAEKGVELFRCGAATHPFDYFSMIRSLNQVVIDLYRRPDKFLEAGYAIIPGMLETAIKAAKSSGVKKIFLSAVRSNCSFVSPQQFQKFVFPFYKEIVRELVNQDLEVILHCDANNDLNLEFFKELPAGKCILHLDGNTNIRKAKDILKGRICLMGDVPSTLLALGSPDQVRSYCQDLISNIGRDGGFILSSGCEVPFNVKPENLQAMLEAARHTAV